MAAREDAPTISPSFVAAVMADFHNGLLPWRAAHEVLRSAFQWTQRDDNSTSEGVSRLVTEGRRLP